MTTELENVDGESFSVSWKGPVKIIEKAVIEKFLRRDPQLHLYSIGDLDDFFWPYTTWFALEGAAGPQAIFLIYSGATPPVLLALEHNPVAAQELLIRLLPSLPSTFYSHLSPGLPEIPSENGCELIAHGEHLRMFLTLTADLPDRRKTCDVRRLHENDLRAITALYDNSYPGNWFDERMIETGKYFGAFVNDRLVGVAGVHVYSRQLKVAALGNITTDPAYRCRGIAAALTNALCNDLIEDGIEHIGLNVKCDNVAAIRCYEKIGFRTHARFFEFMVHKPAQ